MPDLHSRIAVEIERRLAVARAAGNASCEWHQTDPDRGLGRIEDVAGNVVVYDEGAPTGCEAEHIALHDPADAERRYSAALRVLNRHRDCENGRLHGHAVVPWCDPCWTAHPCPEVLDVGAGLDITEGSTTDG